MNNISLTVSRCGIVELASYRDTPLKVNDQDMVSLFEEATLMIMKQINAGMGVTRLAGLSEKTISACFWSEAEDHEL